MEAKAFSSTHRTTVFADGTVRDRASGDPSESGKAAGEGPHFEPHFSEHSFGFRPGRSARQAVACAQSLIGVGRSWVVDIDLEKFFDRVNHDRLMARMAKTIADKRAAQTHAPVSQGGSPGGGL